jgi:hypothetical protein
VSVDERDLGRRASQRSGRFDPAEACAYDDDPGAVQSRRVIGHGRKRLHMRLSARTGDVARGGAASVRIGGRRFDVSLP